MSNEVIMRIIDTTATDDTLAQPQWLEEFDVEAHDGRGYAAATMDRSKAHRFADLAVAMQEWQRVSVKRPVREDGQPNRPLTALTIEIEPAEES